MSLVSHLANISDLDAIAYLSEQWGYPTSHEKMSRGLREILQNTDHRIFVLQQEQEITGWIHGIYSFRVASDPFIEIAGLVVDSRYRRRGIGKLLVEEIVRWAKARDCSLVRVRCQIARKEANLFYSDIGFKEIKQQKVYDLSL